MTLGLKELGGGGDAGEKPDGLVSRMTLKVCGLSRTGSTV